MVEKCDQQQCSRFVLGGGRAMHFEPNETTPKGVRPVDCKVDNGQCVTAVHVSLDTGCTFEDFFAEEQTKG